MRITFQPSGGRGEYEISEDYGGLWPADLLNYNIQLLLVDIPINIEIRVTNDQGKFRLRMNQPERSGHVQYQVANALLMPQPVRSEELMGEGEPVLLDKVYILKNIHLSRVDRLAGQIVRCTAHSLDCENKTHHANQLQVEERVYNVKRIWQNKDKFPDAITSLLARHERIVRAGARIPSNTRDLIDDIGNQLEAYTTEFEVPYIRRADVVPTLLAFLNDIVEEQPLPLDQIEPENIEIRRREVKKWLQYARRRGTESEKFKKAVRAAYNFTCVVCGARFPGTDVNKNPGIDAAHILPWAVYDLDKVYNGLALCKIHHWAFDERLIDIVYRNGNYYVEVSAKAAASLSAPSFSINLLQHMAGPIHPRRLPANPADLPRPELLARRLAELE